MADARKIVMLGAPLLAMATVALGLRVGAGSAMRAAVVHGAPRAARASTFAWQLGTFLEDRGVREAVAVRGLTVIARGENGAEAMWRGESNRDGVAEIRLDLPGVRDGARLDLEVRAEGEADALARGRVTWDLDGQRAPAEPAPSFVRPTRREGDVALDVAVFGERLAPEHPTPLWVRATDRATGRALAGVTIDAEAEPGLKLASSSAKTCDAGFAELSVVALHHVVGIALHARTPEGKTGDYFAGLPVAAGAYAVNVPRVAPGEEKVFDIVAPNARTVAYAEIDDNEGRAFAQALPLAANGTAVPHAAFTVPPLTTGLYWLTTSGEPGGALELAGATVARPFWVSSDPALDDCQARSKLATLRGAGFRRWIALDGFDGQRAAADARRMRGVILAVSSLAVAALLEVVLVLGSSRRAASDLAQVALQLEPGVSHAPMRRMRIGNVVVALLLVLLGFALMASLIAYPFV